MLQESGQTVKKFTHDHELGVDSLPPWTFTWPKSPIITCDYDGL